MARLPRTPCAICKLEPWACVCRSSVLTRPSHPTPWTPSTLCQAQEAPNPSARVPPKLPLLVSPSSSQVQHQGAEGPAIVGQTMDENERKFREGVEEGETEIIKEVAASGEPLAQWNPQTEGVRDVQEAVVAPGGGTQPEVEGIAAATQPQAEGAAGQASQLGGASQVPASVTAIPTDVAGSQPSA